VNNDWNSWYENLAKPSWTPSPDVIGTIWTVLYPVIIYVNFVVWAKFIRKDISFLVVLPFLINLIANLAFTPIQFGLRSLWGAAVCIVIVWVSIVWSMVAIWSHNRTLALLYIPYLVWVSLASILQFTIAIKN
jgi:tryptophan-rich sensory protein